MLNSMLNCLKILRVNYTNHSELVVRVIEQRLLKSVFVMWDQTLNKYNFPKLTD